MKLYGSTTSPFVRHCRLALMQTNTAFELIPADYADSAANSPTQKVPYAQHGEIFLTDSASILKAIREGAQHPFLQDLEDYELFAITNTLMDTAINLFLLKKSGVDPLTNDYLQRQAKRLETGLKALDAKVAPEDAMQLDGHLRLACFIDWAQFRQQLAFEDYPNLLALLEVAKADQHFQNTDPRL